MDRRYLHKTNGHGQAIKKNKDHVALARAKSRAGHLDAQRELEPGAAETVDLPHLERLKLWCLERDAKKRRSEQTQQKPLASRLASTVSRRVSTPHKTNCTQRRTTLTKPMNAVRNSPVPLQKVVTSARNNILVPQTPIVVRKVPTENGGSPDHTENCSELNITFKKENPITTTETKSVNEQFIRSTVDTLSVPDNSSALNVTFDKESSFSNNLTFEGVNQSPVGTAEHDLDSQYEATPGSQSNKRRKTWSKGGQIRDTLHELEMNRSIHDSPLVPQNAEAANYFRYRVDSETKSLVEMVQCWTEYKTQCDRISAAHLDEIEVAIGQSKVLVDQKFIMFLDLCEKCQSSTGEPPVRPSDLEEFWCTTFADVEECKRKFQKLKTLKDMTRSKIDLSTPAPDNSDQAKKNKNAVASASKTNVAHSTVRILRQTPRRLASTAARRNKLNSSTSESPPPAVTPKSAKRRTRTTAIPDEEPHSTT